MVKIGNNIEATKTTPTMYNVTWKTHPFGDLYRALDNKSWVFRPSSPRSVYVFPNWRAACSYIKNELSPTAQTRKMLKAGVDALEK